MREPLEPGRVLREALQVLRADLVRLFRLAPVASVLAAVLMPFLTIVGIQGAAELRHLEGVHLRTGEWSWRDATGDAGFADPPPELARLVARLEAQPFYALEQVADARGRFAAGDTELALELVAGPVPRLEVWRRHDFYSSLFMDRLMAVQREARTEQALPGAVILPEESTQAADRRVARDGIAQVGPFLLLGFAWFFLNVAAVEALVVERERRTLEHLLAAGVSRTGLAWGKLSFILVQTWLPQLAGSVAFLALGYSPWVLSLTALLGLALVPAAVLAFAVYRDMDNALSAGWRNGLAFMLGFPLLILMDDVVGQLSPLYHFSKALTGPPPPGYLLIWAVGFLGMTLVAVWSVPRLARGWEP